MIAAWVLLGLIVLALLAWALLDARRLQRRVDDYQLEEREAQEQTRPHGNVHVLGKDEPA